MLALQPIKRCQDRGLALLPQHPASPAFAVIVEALSARIQSHDPLRLRFGGHGRQAPRAPAKSASACSGLVSECPTSVAK